MEPLLSDTELLERYRDTGNSQWLGTLLGRYHTSLFLVCMKYMRDKQEAREVVQQIQVKIVEAVDKAKIENFQAWLHVIAKNECSALWRKRQRLLKRIRETSGFWFQEEPPDPEIPDDSDGADSRRLDLLQDALNALTETQQTCIRLYYLFDRSYKEISAETGYTLNEIKTSIQNGKRNMKLNIEQKLSRRQT